MKAKILVVIVSILMLGDAAAQIAGSWKGTLDIQGYKLRIVFNISEKEKGHYSSTLDSPDQGAKGIPTDSTEFSGGKLTILAAGINGKYEGTYIEDSSKFDGVWSQAGSSFELDLVKMKEGDEVSAPKRPQTPKAPYPYDSENVTFTNKTDNIELSGTLTLPKEGSNFSAVVLVSGSGPQDRDESLMGHKPFLVLADHLTRNGIAVLRYDDRGTGESKGDFASSDSKDFTTDALAAVEYLMSHNKIDKKKIGIIGHSEGGLIAPMAAERSKDIAFAVLLAGPAVTGEEIILLQAELMSKAVGASDEDLKEQRERSKKVYDIIKRSESGEEAQKELKAYFDKVYSELSDEEKKKPEHSPKFMENQIKIISGPWFRFFLAYDPKPALEALKIPVLAVIGEKDMQVSPEQNIPVLKDALKNGHPLNRVETLKGLNHLFQTAETGAVTEYNSIEETMSPGALELITNWIKEAVSKN